MRANQGDRSNSDRAFKCAKCGGRLDTPQTPTNETVVSCKDCGTPLGTWLEVKRAMKAEARKIA